MIRSIKEVYQYIRSLPPKKVTVAQAADGHVLQAVSAAYAEGYALPVLVGDKARIRAAAEAEPSVMKKPLSRPCRWSTTVRPMWS